MTDQQASLHAPAVLPLLRGVAAAVMVLGGQCAIADGIPLGSLPPEIAAAIKAAPFTQTLIPILGEEKFAQQIIKADEISFAEGAKLTFTNLDVPWVVIAARTIKFAKPESYSYIRRDQAVQKAASGSAGGQGPRGADRPGETGRRGNDADAGGDGGNGTDGATRSLPVIYLVAGKIVDPKGAVPPGLLNLVISARGVDGGDGGRGGSGGAGGTAGNGKEGATSAIDCKEGGGPGGTGGARGRGGKGGAAGRGGNGADMIFVVTKPAYEVLSFTRINNAGGGAGSPGLAGSPGEPGRGGAGGRGNGFCGAKSRGAEGGYQDPSTLGTGRTEQDGDKGAVTAVILPSVDQLFTK